jgi:hypothetical protein
MLNAIGLRSVQAVARHRVKNRCGVISLLSASPARQAIAMTGVFGVTFAAVEGLFRGSEPCAS